jgi:hypothetical protein
MRLSNTKAPVFISSMIGVAILSGFERPVGIEGDVGVRGEAERSIALIRIRTTHNQFCVEWTMRQIVNIIAARTTDSQSALHRVLNGRCDR